MLKRRTLVACLLILLLSACGTSSPGGLVTLPGMPATQAPPVPSQAMAVQPSPSAVPSGQDLSRATGAGSPLAMAGDDPATLDSAGAESATAAQTPSPTSTPIPNQQSVPVQAGEPSPASTVTMPANLRAGPGLHYAVVGNVEPGDILEVIACNPDRTWFELSDGRWIYSDLVANAPRALQVESHIPTPPIR